MTEPTSDELTTELRYQTFSYEQARKAHRLMRKAADRIDELEGRCTLEESGRLAEMVDERDARIAELEYVVTQHHDVNILSECHWCGWQDPTEGATNE